MEIDRSLNGMWFYLMDLHDCIGVILGLCSHVCFLQECEHEFRVFM